MLAGPAHMYLFRHCHNKGLHFIKIVQAYKRDLVYPHYGWIMFGWYPENWWKEEVAGEHIDECTDDQLEEFLRKARPLIIHFIPEPDDHDLTTDANIVS